MLVGSAGDAPTTRDIRTMVEPEAAAHVIDLSGQTTLEVLAGVLASRTRCVTNDSGAMHVAAAVGTPLVAIFGPTSEYETAPLTRRRTRRRRAHAPGLVPPLHAARVSRSTTGA